MSFVFATPEYVAAAATDLANIGSTINAANAAALAPTSEVLAAGADEVSASIAALFGAHAQAYQAISAAAAQFHQQFVQLMSGGRPSLLEAVGRIGVRHRMRLAPALNKPFDREAIVQVIQSLRSPDAFPVPDREAIAAATAISR